MQAIVQDISIEGCRLEVKARSKGHCAPGRTVIIDLGGRARVAGTIAWMDGQLAGVMFDKPLDLKHYAIQFWLERTAGVHFECLIDGQIAA